MRDLWMRFGTMLVVFCVDTALAAAGPTPTIKVPGLDVPLSWINAPLEYRLTSSGIVITAPGKTDKYIDARGAYAIDNAPLLVFETADNNFVFHAEISHPFASRWDAGGLVVEADSMHWVKFAFERDYTGAHRVVSVVTNDYSDDANSIEIDSDSAYLEVARMEDALLLYASKEGKSWYLVRAFNFKAAGALKVGLTAQCPRGKNATITFSDLKYTRARLKDIFKGE
jgi:uncharacterized protein